MEDGETEEEMDRYRSTVQYSTYERTDGRHDKEEN
jgi:hypothetical protein